MAEELKHLLDRIQREGVAKADEKADRIVADAEARAAAIVRDAEEKAGQILARAEKDALSFDERGRKALRQAARDTILSVGGAVSHTLDTLVADRIDKALTIDVLKQMLIKIAEAYASGGKTGNIDLVLGPSDEARLRDFILSELRSAVEKGLKVQSDNEIVSGFRISLADGHVHHDFTRDAIAESLCRLLRPHLADIVRDAITEDK